MATNLVAKNGAKLPTPPALIALPFRNGMGYHNHNTRVNSVNDASILCENFMKFGPVTPELTLLICERQLRDGQKTGAFQSNISRCTGPIFGIFLPYESTLRAHDGSVPYFLICQGSLPWQPNNIAKTLSTPTDTSCIHCTNVRKRIAISWFS